MNYRETNQPVHMSEPLGMDLRPDDAERLEKLKDQLRHEGKLAEDDVMRASKEEARIAILNLEYLRDRLAQKSGKTVKTYFDNVLEFLAAAERKLPKRNVGTRAKR